MENIFVKVMMIFLLIFGGHPGTWSGGSEIPANITYVTGPFLEWMCYDKGYQLFTVCKKDALFYKDIVVFSYVHSVYRILESCNSQEWGMYWHYWLFWEN